MKKIAVLNDLSGLGKCSLTAAIPVISAMGVQAVPLPTAILSNQTGFPSYFCEDYTDRMDAIMDEWEKRGFQPDGIYTGFLAGEAQAEKILGFFRRFCREETLVLVDPVMGDNGKAFGFYTEKFRDMMKLLAKKARVITPNLTEALLLLYGKEGMEKSWQELLKLEGEEYLRAVEKIGEALLRTLPIETAVITGIDYRDGEKPLQIGNLAAGRENLSWTFATKAGGSYSGTGDLFASVLSAGLVKGLSVEVCVKKAAVFLENSIRDAEAEGRDRNEGVCFENHLYELWEEQEEKP